MSKLAVTDFSNRKGSPFHKISDTDLVIHDEVFQKTHFDIQKEKQSELIGKVTRKAADIQSNRCNPNDGCFTEVTTSGAFTAKVKDTVSPPKIVKPTNTNGTKSPLLGFPSSANDLALDAKTDLESDPNISNEVKEKVIEKLFKLVSMVQHTYESKVRIMNEFDKYKETHLKNDLRKEKEHSEQLYKLNMNFQNEVVQSIQRLKSEMEISRNVSDEVDDEPPNVNKDTSIEFHTSENSSVNIEHESESHSDVIN